MTQYMGRDARMGQAQPLAVVVGATSVVAVRANEGRGRIVITNDSTAPVYLARSAVAIVNAGIRLNANGGALVEEPSTEWVYRNGQWVPVSYMYTGPWSAVCSIAGVLCISEE